MVLATSFAETRDPGNEVVVLLPLRVFSLKTSTTGAVAVLFSALSPKKVSVSQCVALELVPRAGAYYKEPATPIISQYNGIFTDQSIFRYFSARNRPVPVYMSTLR